jgi:hypothetical protein
MGQVIILIVGVLAVLFAFGYTVRRLSRGPGGMKRLALFFALLIVAVAGLWTWAYPSATWRYRLTLEVETPEGLKTGSSVIEVQVKDGPSFNPEGARPVFVRGEAVAVDLGSRGVLFALMSSERWSNFDCPVYVVFETFPWPGGPGGGLSKSGRAFYQALRGKAELPVDRKPPDDRLPKLVRFRDVNDQMTVEKVNPSNLEASFGSGVKLVKVMIEMTKDNLTTGIEQRLVWLNSLHGRYLGGAKTTADSPLGLHEGDFRTRSK